MQNFSPKIQKVILFEFLAKNPQYLQPKLSFANFDKNYAPENKNPRIFTKQAPYFRQKLNFIQFLPKNENLL